MTNIGIVGATGLVGGMMRSILIERNFPVDHIRFFASARSAGQTIEWHGNDVKVEDASTADFSGLDLVLLSAGASVSRELCPVITRAGAIAIDNSSAWRMDPDVPLAVSEVNPGALDHIPKGIVANPNCTTMVAMPVLKPLHDEADLEFVLASTYQAVSGAGIKGIDELEEQVHKVAEGSRRLSTDPSSVDLPSPAIFARPIAFNALPFAGSLVTESSVVGETDEEHKFRNESRKILEIPALSVSCTCVRVPVYTGHSVSMFMRFARPITAERAEAILRSSAGVTVVDIPTPLAATGGDNSLVGRFRSNPEDEHALSVFVCGDNLRKGAALNAVQIAELLTQS